MACSEHGCRLQHTVATSRGKVVNHGKAIARRDVMPGRMIRERAASLLADAAHLVRFSSEAQRRERVFLRNMWACMGGQGAMTERTLVDYIRNAKRLDVEQAVAMVLAFVARDVAEALAPHVAEMFWTTSMWREGGDFDLEDGSTLAAARGRKMTRFRSAVAPMARGECVDHEKGLVDFLMRVRRDRAAEMSGKQRLQIPKYLIALVPEEERELWTESYMHGSQTPVDIEEDRIVRVSKKNFQRMQRWLWRLGEHLSEESAYIREVAELERDILYGNIRALERTTDRAALAFGFMAVQRRLQLKVKGGGRGMLQNRPDIITSFEEELARHATDVQALLAIRPPQALQDRSSAVDELIPLVDRACSLMEKYVMVFGNGLFENLRYRNSGGSDSGVTYNLLVDLVATLRERGKGHFTIGPCHKFLIGTYRFRVCNDAWQDDAFPGWVEWLQARQNLHIQLPAEIQK